MRIQKLQPAKFKIGDEVFVLSQPDAVGVVIKQPRCLAGDWWYTVSFGIRRKDCPEQSLEKFAGGHDILSLLKQNLFSGRDGLSKIITFTKLKQPLQNNIYAFRASRTEFHEYQFKPLVKLLNSINQRLLIADEVGLGKTIEAGFIYQELDARHSLDRVLVVCPSALRAKWSEEMARRFGEEFDILDSMAFRQFLTKIQTYNPFIKLRGISSLQTLRSERMLDLLEEVAPTFDLVIIDEAHHMRNSGTLSNRLGKILSEQAETLLLLTATPIHLGNENLFQLLQILDPEEYDNFDVFVSTLQANHPIIEAERTLRQGKSPDLQACHKILRTLELGPFRERFTNSPVYHDVLQRLKIAKTTDKRSIIQIQRDISQLNLLGHILTRTRKREVAEKQPKRQAMLMPVRWTEQEQELYDKVTDYCRMRIENTRQYLGIASWFPVITLQRQIASCIPAAINHYLSDTDSSSVVDGELSDIELEDFAEEDINEIEFPSLRDDPGLLAILGEARNNVLKDSKIEKLLEQLNHIDQVEPNRKILIFSYFKKTLHYLSTRLEDSGYRTVVVTGDVPSRPNDPEKDERGQRLLQFKNDPDVRIMLSSEVGSEGLDFQFAHILINYDLPWNPMLVEQRIGRLDRLGQKSERILIYNFAIPGTIEERILGRLYSRIRIFQESIGDLESILGTEILQLTMELLSSKLTEEEQNERIEECTAVIERRRQEISVLEKEAAQFIGHDAYFQEELEQIQKNKRYITSEELELLIGDFIRNEVPATIWEKTSDRQVFRLKLDKEFSNLLRANTSRDDDPSIPFFIDRTSKKPTLLTCNSEKAFEDEELVLVNSKHILIRTIIKYYENHLDRLHPISCVALSLEQRGIAAGDYLYFLYLIEHQSARPGKTLEAVFISVNEESTLDKGESDFLLSNMIIHSQTLASVELVQSFVGKCYEIAEEIVGKRIATHKDSLQKINEDIVSRRISSLEATYKSKRGKIEVRLQKARREQRQERYIRMLEGTIRNLDTRYESKLKEIEAGRRVDMQLELFGAGVVRIKIDG